MKKLFLSLLFVAALAAPSFAKEFKLPDDDAVVSVTVPDAWKPKETTNGVEANSEDEELYFSVNVSSGKKLDAMIDEAFEDFKTHKVVLQKDSQKKSESKVNGMESVNFSWDGKDEDGPAKINVSVIGAAKDKALLVIFWASPEGMEKHAKAVDKIVQSIKPVGK
jgi:hypothetical protein